MSSSLPDKGQLCSAAPSSAVEPSVPEWRRRSGSRSACPRPPVTPPRPRSLRCQIRRSPSTETSQSCCAGSPRASSPERAPWRVPTKAIGCIGHGLCHAIVLNKQKPVHDTCIMCFYFVRPHLQAVQCQAAVLFRACFESPGQLIRSRHLTNKPFACSMAQKHPHFQPTARTLAFEACREHAALLLWETSEDQ